MSWYMKLLCALALFAAAGAHAQSGCAYDPRIDGTWTTYQVYKIGGTWDNKTHQVTVQWRNAWKQATYYWKTVPNAIGSTPCFAEVGPALTLYDAVCSVGDFCYLGETGSPASGALASPGEPLIPFEPHGGEHIELDHLIQWNTAGHLVFGSMKSVFYAITGPGYTWTRADGVQLPDCVWTSLEERPGDPTNNYVYNYVFQRGKGMVNVRWGRHLPHSHELDTSWAFELQAIAWGSK